MSEHRPTKPTIGGGDSAGGFIGVPDGFTTLPTLGDWFRQDRAIMGSAGTIGATGATPKYADGTEAGILDMPSEEVARLQIRMARAGLIGPETNFRAGQVLGTNDPTYAAFKKLLGAANRYGTDYTTILAKLETTPLSRGDGKTQDAAGNWSSGAGQVSQARTESRTDRNEALFTDPVTARDTVRRVMESELGRAPDAAEYKRFVANLHSQEAGDDVSTTTSVYGKAGNLKSSSTMRADDTQDVSADVLANQAVRSGALGRERNTKMAGVDYYQAAMNVLGAGGGNL